MMHRAVTLEFPMTRKQGMFEEDSRVFQARPGLVLEQDRRRLQGQLRSDLASKVPAHAVGNQHQETVAGEAIAHAILVARAGTKGRVLEDREAHLCLLETSGRGAAATHAYSCASRRRRTRRVVGSSIGMRPRHANGAEPNHRIGEKAGLFEACI